MLIESLPFYSKKAYVDPPCINPYDCSMTPSGFYSNCFWRLLFRVPMPIERENQKFINLKR